MGENVAFDVGNGAGRVVVDVYRDGNGVGGWRRCSQGEGGEGEESGEGLGVVSKI